MSICSCLAISSQLNLHVMAVPMSRNYLIRVSLIDPDFIYKKSLKQPRFFVFFLFGPSKIISIIFYELDKFIWFFNAQYIHMSPKIGISTSIKEFKFGQNVLPLLAIKFTILYVLLDVESPRVIGFVNLHVSRYKWSFISCQYDCTNHVYFFDFFSPQYRPN